MISIEFFSGRATVSKFLKSKGYETFTLDIDKQFDPDLLLDILNITQKRLPDKADFLWFSPVCKLLSRAADSSHWIKETIGYRKYAYTPNSPDARLTVRMVEKVTEIIKWYPGVKFVIENPIGRIHHLETIKSLGHYRYAVNYGNYGFSYSKETYLFTNFLLPFSSKKVSSNLPGLRTINSKIQRSAVPIDLISTIYNYL